MQKVFFMLLLMAMLTACGADPVRQAEADAIRTRAAQDAADRTQARENPAPAPVVVQDGNSAPWLLLMCSFGFMVASGLAGLIAVAMTRELARGKAQPEQVVQRVIIDRVGRGQYRLTDVHGSRLLDMSSQADIRLLERVSQNEY